MPKAVVKSRLNKCPFTSCIRGLISAENRSMNEFLNMLSRSCCNSSGMHVVGAGVSLISLDWFREGFARFEAGTFLLASHRGLGGGIIALDVCEDSLRCSVGD